MEPVPEEQSGLTRLVERFCCTGPECVESCCAGWQITLDAPALVTLRGLRDEQVDATLAKSVHWLKEDSPTMQAGYLKLQANGACPFLRADQLCGIQAVHGELPMPLGCRVYPRVHHRVDGAMVSALRASCPEAARMLLTTDGIRPGGQQTHAREALESGLRELPSRGDAQSLFWQLRQTHSAILHERALPFAERMKAMGRLAQWLDAEPDGDAALALRGFLHEWLGEHDKRNEAKRCSRMDEKPLGFLLAATEAALRFAGGNARFRALTARVQRGLKRGLERELEIGSEDGMAGWQARCERLRSENLEPFLRSQPQLEENFVWNEIVCGVYPMRISASGEIAWCGAGTAFAQLAVPWTWWRLYLLGMAGDGGLDMESAIDCAQSLSRAVFSRQAEFEKVCAGWARLATVVPLDELLSV